MSRNTSSQTVVVGAGIIGASIAFELQRRGRSVILVDRDAPGRGASYGNMASIAVTEFMPVARPSVWKHIPGWLLDSKGPIRIKPGYMPQLVPWFLRFALASMPLRVRRFKQAGAVLCKRSLKDTQNLLATLGLSDHLSSTGCLTLYANDQEFRADSERLAMLYKYGFDYEVLNAGQLRELEPSICDQIFKAALLPDNRTVQDPLAIVQALVEAIRELGGQVIKAGVTGFETSDRITGVKLDNGKIIMSNEVILCAGAFTARLSKTLGEPMPLETERGYSTQIMKPEISLNHSVIWPAKAFMISPTAGGIRVGGTVEMAGLDAPADYRRAKITVGRAKEAFPDLQLIETSEWMGHRPAFPDTIPVISESAKLHGLFYATGHGHLGLTHAATTALLMSDLVMGKTPGLDMTPYSITRF